MLRLGHRSFRRFCSKKTVRLTVVEPDGEEQVVDAKLGNTMLEVAVEHDLDVEGACDGTLACSTCHMIFEPHIYKDLPTKEEEEDDMLDLAVNVEDTSRLGCQVRVTEAFEGTTIRVPHDTLTRLGVA